MTSLLLAAVAGTVIGVAVTALMPRDHWLRQRRQRAYGDLLVQINRLWPLVDTPHLSPVPTVMPWQAELVAVRLIGSARMSAIATELTDTLERQAHETLEYGSARDPERAGTLNDLRRQYVTAARADLLRLYRGR